MTTPVTDPEPDLSIVVPVFNEEPNLESLVDELRTVMAGQEAIYEVLLVDDGSTDRGLEILRSLALADSRLRVVHHRRNLGQSAALISGFERARAQVVVTLDADLQNDPADIPRLLDELHDCDVVCGVRSSRRDGPIRRLSSWVANGVRNRATRESVTDVGCSLRACRAESLRDLPTFSGMHRFLPTLLKLNGARIKEIDVSHRQRVAGKSKYGIANRLWRSIADLIAVRWMQRRHIDRRLAVEVTTTSSSIPRSSSDLGSPGPALKG